MIGERDGSCRAVGEKETGDEIAEDEGREIGDKVGVGWWAREESGGEKEGVGCCCCCWKVLEGRDGGRPIGATRTGDGCMVGGLST